jgi:hypothetical protein
MVKLWINKIKMEINDDKGWAKLRIKKDKVDDEDYIDILIGMKNKKPHIHFGLNLDNSMKFSEYRGVTKAISRKIESRKYGLLQDAQQIIDPTVTPARNIIIQIRMEGTTGEVKINKFEFE